MSGIFISHTHGDWQVAEAVATLIKEAFNDRVQVKASSSKELDSSITPGGDWFRWIVDQVREADVALILLTPTSIQKPWVIWEAGAVGGAAFAASDDADTARAIPVRFGLKSDQVPSPFSNLQVVSGADEADMHKLVSSLLDRFAGGYKPSQISKMTASLEAAVKTYIPRIRTILGTLPPVITEGAIQEWLDRLDHLERDGRYSDVGVIENWMDIAFGRDRDEERPLDMRIHRRLGELYAKAKRSGDAARQFRLASQLVPRDIYFLRLLGKAYLDAKDPEKTRDIVEAIVKLDPKAFEHNEENAALKARLHRESNDLHSARKVLQTARENIKDSHYLGDLLGQVYLELDQLDEAKEVYSDVRRVLDKLDDHSVWTYATALTAAIVCGDAPRIEASIAGLRKKMPTGEQLDSIERGAKSVVQKLNADPAILARLRSVEQRNEQR